MKDVRGQKGYDMRRFWIRMNITLKKSRYHKPSTKSGNEDNNPEVEELKKYRELIEKLL